MSYDKLDKVCIIGLGEIGTEMFKEVEKRYPLCFGMDIDSKRVEHLNRMGYEAYNKLPLNMDVYIISVYSPKQVKDVIDTLPLDRNPLVVIESTVNPGFSKEVLKKYPNIQLVIFPHRYNPNDPKHHIFNLKRIIGSYSREALAKALRFYRPLIKPSNLMVVDADIAELSKPLENAYRFVEIALAEELKLACSFYGIDFNQMREAMNSKWNIDLKEAREGIGGHCLPKDCSFINKFFKDNIMFESAIKVDQIYRHIRQINGQSTSNYRLPKERNE